MKKIAIFGAGNIGRSFIGALFCSGEFNVTFIDTDKKLIELINKRKTYNIIIKKDGTSDKTLSIGPVSAINGYDKEAVFKVLIETDYVATAVGLRALPLIIPGLCGAALYRFEQKYKPLDIILAENVHNGKELLYKEAQKSLPDDIVPSKIMGAVECSIGKMVPIMKDADLNADPLQLFAEEYNSLILDKNGFLTSCPQIEGIQAVTNIQAYVDRKLYIHNLGHASAAYFGFLEFPKCKLIADVMKIDSVRDKVTAVMKEASKLLMKLYPEEFTGSALNDHIDDLLNRFSNRALGDTVFRVGKDISRKLDKSDRVLGAVITAVSKGISFDKILDVFLAGLQFKATDENGNLFPSDKEFINRCRTMSPDLIGEKICGLRKEDPYEAIVIKRLSNINKTII